MLINDTGIVLHTLKYNDTSNIVHLYTQHAGRCVYIVSSTRSRKSKVQSTLFQPFAEISFTADAHPKYGLPRIREVKSAYPSIRLLSSPPKLAQALFLAEVLYHVLNEEEPDTSLYRFLAGSMRCLDQSMDDAPNFCIVFLLHLSRYLGIFPGGQRVRYACYFDMMNGEFAADEPSHPLFLPAQQTAYLLHMMRVDFSTMHHLRLNRHMRSYILDRILTYYRIHVASFPVMKSMDVLKSLFDE